MRQRLVGFFVLVLSLGLAVGLAEAGLRVASAHWLRVLDVEMWRYARFVKSESNLPGLVEAHRPNTEAVLMGARVRTDGRGFRRADPDTEARRRPDDRRVVALGDSLTFGWGVAEGQTYADQLERLLARQCPARGGRRATVWNTGVGNSNTSMELTRYEDLVRPVHPDWLILGYFINDAEPDPVPSGNLLIRHLALAGLLSTRLRQESENRLRDYNSYYHSLYTDGAPGWERTKRALHQLADELRADRVHATLILLPELHDPYRFGGFADVYARVRQLGEADGFEVIDPSAAFPQGRGERYWVHPLDAHPNPEAQAIFARALAGSRYACLP